MKNSFSFPFEVKIKTIEWHDRTQFEISTDFAKVNIYFLKTENRYMFTGLYVEPGHRRQGLATKLLNFCDFFINYSTPTIYVDIKYPWLKEFYEKRNYHVELEWILD